MDAFTSLCLDYDYDVTSCWVSASVSPEWWTEFGSINSFFPWVAFGQGGTEWNWRSPYLFFQDCQSVIYLFKQPPTSFYVPRVHPLSHHLHGFPAGQLLSAKSWFAQGNHVSPLIFFLSYEEDLVQTCGPQFFSSSNHFNYWGKINVANCHWIPATWERLC